MVTDDFVFIDQLVPGIRWDAKYATWDNFTGKPVDGYAANRIVGTTTLCAALGQAQDEARSRGFGLLLWDGYRPQRAVDCFLAWSRRTRIRAAKSGHSRGSTVDLTLYHLGGDGRRPCEGSVVCLGDAT
jgi:D-alanyl-D-alanine dipeptidase